MRKKSQAAKNGANGDLSTEAAPESTMTASERPEGISPSLQKVKSSLASRSSSKRQVNKFSVRRSERIQNSTPRSLKIQSVVEEITLSESDEEDELPDELPDVKEKSLPPPDQENDWPEFMFEDKNLEGKIDYIIKLLESHGHSINSIKAEVIKKSFSMETVPTPDMKYKSMYIASQKKIEELAEENRVLTQKLESARDQFEAYKMGTRDVNEALEKMKDVILISNGSRVSEGTQATSQAGLDKVTSPEAGDVPPSSKRKKLTKQI